MFTVTEKATGKKFTVYGMNGPAFLIYDEIEDCWMYRHMNDFFPQSMTMTRRQHEKEVKIQ